MKKKSLWDIYKRNVKGVLRVTFETVDGGEFAFVLPALFLPLTLTFGAGIKSLTDYYSRKEVSDDGVSAKVDSLNEESMDPFVKQISTYHAKSLSSRRLITALTRTIPAEFASAISACEADKKLELQKDQLGFNADPTLADKYKESYVSSLPLDDSHQKTFDEYVQARRQSEKEQQLVKQKSAIKEFLSADHNYGKKMQQMICHYFFPPASVPVVDAPDVADRKRLEA